MLVLSLYAGEEFRHSMGVVRQQSSGLPAPLMLVDVWIQHNSIKVLFRSAKGAYNRTGGG